MHVSQTYSLLYPTSFSYLLSLKGILGYKLIYCTKTVEYDKNKFANRLLAIE